jgi:hypothetical protein
MPVVNWKTFEQLPGGNPHNFEMLCRALVRRHYARFGRFMALASQPGVEFHLKLDSSCALGNSGAWFGWQCRWYDWPNGKALGASRRSKILDALRKTEKFLPELSDWVLWTRYPLTKADQKWFYKLKTKMRLHLWAAIEAEELLSGDAEIFRGTYFGELVLIPGSLAALHQELVARIKRRWLPEAHQPVQVERTLRRMLGEAESWSELITVANRLIAASKSISTDLMGFVGPVADSANRFVGVINSIAEILKDAHTLVGRGDLDLLRERLGTRSVPRDPEMRMVVRQLRGARHVAALRSTNALADIQVSRKLLDEIDSFLGTRLIGVLADAGGGKSQLAAQLTAPMPDRPAGIILYGQDLHARQGLDDLARKVVINGKPVASMEALVAALDAAGQRARRRLPIVIDGLNEAEDPRDWKGPLASLNHLLNKYPYVLVICTLRTGARLPPRPQYLNEIPDEKANDARMAFADEALPDEVKRLEMPDFGEEESLGAMRRYFQYYKINSRDAELPFLLSHPLTLRLFCEVTNPKREKEVGIEAMPGSLTALFESYLTNAAERIAELSPLSHRYYVLDVRRAFDEIGASLWDYHARSISERDLRKKLGDESRPWNASIIMALEQEGIILRIPGNAPGDMNVMAVYDAMGGHLAASAILARHGGNAFEQWLKAEETIKALSAPPPIWRPPAIEFFNIQESSHEASPAHPLATDVFRALVGLVPRRPDRQQLWPLLDDPLRTLALRGAANLEAAYLDNATVTALSVLAASSSGKLFPRLRQTRGAVMHPLNADFLASVLGQMEVAARDLCWTEWIRRNLERSLDDLRNLERRWHHELTVRTPSDLLRARWVMWMLTSTTKELRANATRTLYWFGRGAPAALFELTFEALRINDPYIAERMLAACYGVAMARHIEFADNNVAKIVLPHYARQVYELIFKENAPCSTTHILTREYARRLLELALVHHRKLFTKTEVKRIRPPYKDGGQREWKESETKRDKFGERKSPFHMDFENYTLGRLVPDRANYNFEHPEYQRIRAQVLWRIEQLGWTDALFNNIEQQIMQAANHPHGLSDDEKKKTDRYGKKYSWIAFYEMTGLLHDQGKLAREMDGRTWEVDIDPSFPVPLPKERLIADNFLGESKATAQEWIVNGNVPDIVPYLHMPKVHDLPGPWVALNGFFTQEDAKRGRRIFCFVRSFLVKRHQADSFVKCLSKQDLASRWLPEIPRVIYTFAGEIPWCDTYPKNGLTDLRFVVKEKRVKVKRKRRAYFLDGKQIQLLRFYPHGSNMPVPSVGVTRSFSPEELKRVEVRTIVVDEEIIKQTTKRFKALIPVKEFGWEGERFASESIRAIPLAKEITRELHLVGQPQTFDSFTKDGTRATFGCSEASDYNNSQDLFFMREDLLKQYLKKKQFGLIWAIWGEREYATEVAGAKWDAGEGVGLKFRSFKVIRRFDG